MTWLHDLLDVGFRVVPAHAARATKDVESLTVSRLPMFASIATRDGKRLRPRDYLVVRAEGDSLAHFGILNGTRLAAKLVVEDQERRKLNAGDVVLVNGKAMNSNTGRRLRVLREISGNVARFEADKSGRSHRERPLSEIEAIITHSIR